jgi:uncharacterized protein (TIGR00251 family)
MNTTLVSDSRDGARFLVRVSPRASRTAITGFIGEGGQAALRIALHAPPVEGRANAALIEFLAELLGVPRSAIEIAGGQHTRHKTIVVRGHTAADVLAAVTKALNPQT